MNRDLNELSHPFQDFLTKALLELPQIFLSEGYRSQERQNELYAQGRTKPGKIITWTKKSLHTARQAADIAFVGGVLYPPDIDGKINPKWLEVAKVMRKHHIKWGYEEWGRDKPHFYYSGMQLHDTDTPEYLAYKKPISRLYLKF